MDSDEDEIPLTLADIIPLVIKTFQSFTVSLAVIATFFATVNVGLAYIHQSRIDPSQVLVSLSMINHQNHHPILLNAIKYSPRFQGDVVLYSLASNGCNASDFNSTEMDQSKLSMVIITQGNCTLYSKASNAKLYGFSAVLVYNQPMVSSIDRPNTLKDLDMTILSLNSVNFGRIVKLMSNESVCPALVKSNFPNILSFKSIMMELILNLIVIYFSAVVVLAGWLLIYMLGNILLYRNFRFYQAIVDGCLVLSDNYQSRYVPKLQSIPFPEKTLNQKHIEELKGFKGVFESDISSYHDSCCICLEEFQVCNKVRALPCRHLFHSCWYLFLSNYSIDPWLLDHNRLCPICQQDVLKSFRIRDQRNAAITLESDYDSDDLVRRGTNHIRGSSIKYSIARWIQRQLG